MRFRQCARIYIRGPFTYKLPGASDGAPGSIYYNIVCFSQKLFEDMLLRGDGAVGGSHFYEHRAGSYAA